MRRTEILQEIRKMRFEEAYGVWTEGRLTQEEAARILGVCDRTFRRYVDRYEERGLDGLLDKRMTQASSRRAPVDEVMALSRQYEGRYRGWNVKHFYSWYRRDGGQRSYTWVKNTLQSRGLVLKTARKGSHRKRRDPSPLTGMIVHQDGSAHEWVPGKKWDLIVTMDDATNEHYSMFFVQEEGTTSSFQGVRDVILQKGLFSSIYTDRGSHYWYTPKAGGAVSKGQLTQFGRAMKHMAIEMIPAYSPRHGEGASVPSVRVGSQGIGSLWGRWPNGRCVPTCFQRRNAPCYREMIQPLYGPSKMILCEQLTADNCVSFEGKTLRQTGIDVITCHSARSPLYRNGPRK